MPYEFFVVPIHDDGAAATALNKFLSTHRVLAVERRWVEQGAQSFWAFCVDWLVGPSPASKPDGAPSHRNKVDYKAVLPPAEFQVFAALRDWRKRAAEAEAVPLYAVFTNQQLAAMVQNRVRSKADLGKITGVGDARVEKYGNDLLALLAAPENCPNEANGPPAL